MSPLEMRIVNYESAFELGVYCLILTKEVVGLIFGIFTLLLYIQGGDLLGLEN